MWTFIQNEILGMQWLNRLIGPVLGRQGWTWGLGWGAVCSFSCTM